jgi:hypothetical integral membrane protein (TIGR02206 family)
MPGFTPFSLLHVAILAGYAAVTAALAVLGLKWRGTPRERPLHVAWTAFVALVQAVNIIYWATPPNLDPSSSLPLHVCDIAGITAVLVLATRARVWRTVLYYWGLGLSTQAFLTPVITDGPDTFRFHLFFASHLTIVATAVYDVVVRRYSPAWRDFFVITGVMLAWIAVVLPLDITMHWNYGYIGNTKPLQPTLIDRLGPWPLRLVWMFLIAEGAFFLMTIVWCKLNKSTAPPTDDTD